MEISEEQKKRAEANRLAAIEKRKCAIEARGNVWTLFKCRKMHEPPQSESTKSNIPLRMCFEVVLEICSPDEFSVIPRPLSDSPFPGEEECFHFIESCFALLPLRCIQSQVGKKAVFRLDDYEVVSEHLKKLQGIQLQEIPYKTSRVIQKFSAGGRHHWMPILPNHLSDNEVDHLIAGLPKLVRDSLLPFQLEGVRFGLRRGARCLIADEMGLGKTLQAIAIASCFLNEGAALIVCPALLRYSWAEELERWLPLLPTDIHLIFGHHDNLDCLGKNPKVVVISFTMLNRLRSSMLGRKWAVMIVDESHYIRCTKKKVEPNGTKTVLDVAEKADRIVLLTGTPSLSRPFDIFHQINILWPGLLGNDKYEFAKNYCSPQIVRGSNGMVYKDFSRGIRLEELYILLTQTLMIRRLKEHVLTQLPPKRRQIIRMKLKDPDVRLALAASGRSVDSIDDEYNGTCNEKEESPKQIRLKVHNQKTLRELSYQELGIAKLSGFREWFSDHNMFNKFEDEDGDNVSLSDKIIIFAHHIKVLDGIHEFLSENSIQFVRIDGSTSARDRKVAVETFRTCKEVRCVVIGITAGGVGLDFSSAQSVVFLELPKSASEMLQAEDRAHRRGQTNAVNVYIFCAMHTSDESHWLKLNKSLYRVSSMMNGKVNAVKGIEIDDVSYLDDLNDNSHHENRKVIDDITMQSSIENDGFVSSPCSEQTDNDSKNVKINMNILDGPHHNSPDLKTSMSDEYLETCSTNRHESISLTSSCKVNHYNGGERCKPIDDLNCTHDGVFEHEDGSIQSDSLRFEVSQFTGRIHLYHCSLLTNSRPKPLFENFRPEDLESLVFNLKSHKTKATVQTVKTNPAFLNVFRTFVSEWNNLRPIERNKLLGRPLQLPLHLELCYLKESINHDSGGLLKGRSKRRLTPWSEICNSLPSGAVWKKISLRQGSATVANCVQAWTLEDEPLCKLCQRPCVGKLAKNPQYFEDLFCSLDCLKEYRVRTSGRFLRDALFQLEHGVCTSCKLDCHALIQRLRPLSVERRRVIVKEVAPRIASNASMLEKIIYEPTEGNVWHADHIVPVYKGGGECRLENMRTLCVACHSDVTKAQRVDRHFTRMQAKEQLKVFMEHLREETRTGNVINTNVGDQENVGQDVEDDLLVHVPGSSYSRLENKLT